MAGEEVTITKSNVEAFSNRLNDWSQSLDAKEITLLHVLLESAESSIGEKAELSEDELGRVAGGVNLPSTSLGGRSFNILSHILGRGDLMSGGVVTGGVPR